MATDGGGNFASFHHERLMPGRRVSWPHAEADEDEFVFVIEGEPDLWIDGELRRLKAGDGVGFPSGTGISHTFINNSDKDGGCWWSESPLATALAFTILFIPSAM